MKKIYKKIKFIPTFYGFCNNYEKKEFYCYWEKGIYDKYGLHYATNNNSETVEKVTLKGKRYARPPYSFNTYDEMMKETEKLAQAHVTVAALGNIRRTAVFLILDLDEYGNLLHDACGFDGFVNKRGTIFNITSDGTYDGKKKIVLTSENRHLVFPNIAKAAQYVHDNYGRWAASHYLKSYPAIY